MTTVSRSFDWLANVDGSFHVIRPWFGSFELDQRPVRCELDSNDWVRLSAPLEGSEKDLIHRQCHVLLPVKIVAGPALVAEMPLTETLASTFPVLRSILHRGLKLLESADPESVDTGAPDADAAARLESMLDQTAFAWQRGGDSVVTHVGPSRILACVRGTSVVFQSTVIYVASRRNPSLDALTHFALATNARLRFARSTFVAGRLVQEVAVPAAVLSAALVSHAVGAISTAFHVTKRACAALADSRIAEQYVEFHKQERDRDADTDH
jgi:hypothetical protein